MMEAARTSETSVDNHFTRQYNPEDSSEHQTSHYTTEARPYLTLKSVDVSYSLLLNYTPTQFDIVIKMCLVLKSLIKIIQIKT
jgi:hypothetical protein